MSTQPIYFMKRRLHQAVRRAWSAPVASISAMMLTGALMSSPVMAAQAGGIKGKVMTETADVAVSDVTVTATSDVMPKPRTVTTKADGTYNLPALKPGIYTLTFTSANGTVRQMTVDVLLDQTSNVDVDFEAAPVGSTEVIQILGSRVSHEGDSSLTNALGKDIMSKVPSGQDYRSMLAIIPGVQYSENATLGQSVGGSGRDNKYGFDGVDVSLPMYGNLSSEPSTQDVAYVTIDRGGAKAIGFNRAGGMAVNTMSKSGTNDFHANVEYILEPSSLSASKDKLAVTSSTYEQEKSWISGNVSGALIQDELFFYGSFYHPEVTYDNKETAYGPTKDYNNERDEYFGKLTWAPTDDLLLNLSYRDSNREVNGASVGSTSADSTSAGSTNKQKIFIFDGSYIIGDYTTVTFQYSDFEAKIIGRPDTIFSDVNPSVTGSLDIDNLDTQGLFHVPTIKTDEGYDNELAQDIINAYGYTSDSGVLTGGGYVGGDSTIDNDDFYRKSFEVKLDHELELGNTLHNLHFGLQWKRNKEVLARLSNGWGTISYVGGLAVDNFESDTPIYYAATLYSNSLSTGTESPKQPLTSESESYNFEFNDSIKHGDFTYNIGFLLSNDILYGQGLRASSSSSSGYVVDPGHKYKMYELDFTDMIQPRLGITWNYNGKDSVFANFASYNPETTSLARAASWDRNNQSTKNVYFDVNGDVLGYVGSTGSSGKLFQDDLKARRTDEITIGMTKYLSDELFLRTHVRQRKAFHPWEDVPNNARTYGDYGPFGGVPENLRDKGLYIADLATQYSDMGLTASDGTYVIAELDGAENTYYEFSVEGDYTGDNVYLNVSYVWSHYFGNYDQDRTSTAGSSDGNLYVGSSNLGDGRGRMLWDNKYGNLHGDRPHIVKAMGYYTTDWSADIGFNFVFQSGDVWEAWDGGVYTWSGAPNGYSSDTIRYSEPAGSRREASHWQLDLNYAQNFNITEELVVKFKADIYNVFDKQTGYNYDPIVSNTTFGQAQSLINPRRVQLSVNIGF